MTTKTEPQTTTMTIIDTEKSSDNASTSAIASATNLSEKDEAIAMVGEQEHELDPALVARTVRKLDFCLLPVMLFGYGLVYYDKAILGSAALFGMTTDLELSVILSPPSVKPPVINTARLSWATSLFYFGMLAGLYPLTFALQCVPRANQTGRLLGVLVIVWSAICASTAGVTSYKTLYVQRFFLGFFEAVIPTSFMIIISSYYTQEEQALRQSWWYSASPLFTIIGGGLNYGFSHVRGGHLKSWQYIYLFAGALTFGFGVFCFFFAPSTPLTAWFLSEDERFAAVERLRREQTGVRCSRIKMEQVKESVTDDLAKTALVFIIMAAGYTINGAITGFGPLIVSTFNYTALEAILLQFPVGGLGFLSMVITGWVATRYKNIRMIMVALFCLPVIAGCVIIWKSEWSQIRAVTPVVGYTMTAFFCPVVTLTIATAMSNVAGHTKKSFMSATIFVGYCVGNIVGPLMVVSETRVEHYPELWLGLIICYIICIFAAVALYIVLARANKKKEKALLEITPDPDEVATQRAKLAFQDLTDVKNPYFRYVL